MTAPAPTTNTLSTISAPRLRFIFATTFVASSAIYALSRIISGTEIPSLYRTAMSAAILTELLTLKLFFPNLSLKPEALNIVSSSSVMPHLLLSIFLWLNSSSFLIQMIATAIVYLYLVIEYIPTDTAVSQSPYWRVYGKPYADSLIPKKEMLLNLSAHLEIFNLVLILVSIIRMTGNLIHLLVFTQYLVSQYVSSPIMNRAILVWDGMLVKLLNDPRCPAFAKTVDQKARQYLQLLISFTNQFVKPIEASNNPNVNAQQKQRKQ